MLRASMLILMAAQTADSSSALRALGQSLSWRLASTALVEGVLKVSLAHECHKPNLLNAPRTSAASKNHPPASCSPARRRLTMHDVHAATVQDIRIS